MQHRIEQLQLMKMGEVRALVTQSGMGWDKSEKKAELIERLLMIPEPPKRPQPERPKVDQVALDKNGIIEVLRPYMERGLQVYLDGEVWTIKLKNHVESGHVTVPAAVLRRRAEAFLRG